MAKRFLGHLRGTLALIVYSLNTVFWACPLFVVVLAKVAVPFCAWRQSCTRLLDNIVDAWVGVNSLNLRFISRTSFSVQGLEGLRRNQWYLVLSNHQSWSDVLVLQKVFFRKIPQLKFFIKSQLLWLPVFGQAWWAMDYPFMKRYSKAKLAKHPELKGRDLEITKKACAKFKALPAAMMNFAEGTRFSPKKREQQGSPHANLLRPKAGGTSFALGALGDKLGSILNVTIAYPQGGGSFWDFLCGRMREIRVLVEPMPLGPELVGDYAGDPEYRARFQGWLNKLWTEKDCKLAQLMGRKS